MKRVLLTASLMLALPACALAQTPDAMQAQDVQARSLMWTGHANQATRVMREYVAGHPHDHQAVIDLARYLSWAGDYAGAIQVLEAHPDAMRTDRGQVVLASVLAWGGWYRQALQVNAAPLAADANGLLPNYTQAIALRQSARPRAALPYVAAVERASPGSRDAHDLARAVRVRTDSFVSLDYRHTSDSDDLVRSQPTLRAEVAQDEALRWTAELGRWQYRAPLTSPFVSVDGRRSVTQTRALFGARYAPGLYTTLSAAVGHSHIPGDSLTLWQLGLDQHVTDQVQLNLLADHDRVDASPRSVSLGIARTGLAGHVQWRPDFNWTGDLWLQREHYSDGNNRTHWSAAVRRATVRRVGLMLDLGVAGEHLAFDKNPGNGYYAPSNYRRYAVTGSLYVGMGQDAGLSLQAQLGRQKDENLVHWRRAADINAELVVGIFSPWQLNVYTGYSDRLLNTGAYRGRHWGVRLTRRF